MADIYTQASCAIRELMENAPSLQAGDIVVIGCSTSEIAGQLIGTASSEEIAKQVMDAIFPAIRAKRVYLAVQCCEHLNRALVVERACMERYDLTEVCVRPHLHAGGAFALQAMARFDDYVIAEDIHGRAKAGMDIGGTLIGMHMQPVAVPIHSPNRTIGMAHLTMARSRPKYIGGPRAQYDEQPTH